MTDRTADLLKEDEDQFFYKKYLIEHRQKAVGWIDMMGMRDRLDLEMLHPSVMLGEILSDIYYHIDQQKVDCYSLGDAVLLVSDDGAYVEKFLRHILHRYVNTTIKMKNYENPSFHRVMRAGFATGKLFTIDYKSYNRDYRQAEPFPNGFTNPPYGPALAQAFLAEKGSPYSLHRYEGRNYHPPMKWWKNTGLSRKKRESLIDRMKSYFDEFSDSNKYQYTPYDADKRHHKKLEKFFELEGYEWERGTKGGGAAMQDLAAWSDN
jgi:hypothetical protein